MARLDAISDPVRLRLVRHLEHHGDASLQELAEGAGVHLNTARAHVAELESAGVLVRGAAAPAAGPGRAALLRVPRNDDRVRRRSIHMPTEAGAALEALPTPQGVDLDAAAAAARDLLVALGADPDDAGLRDTPRRVAAAYAELLTPE